MIKLTIKQTTGLNAELWIPFSTLYLDQDGIRQTVIKAAANAGVLLSNKANIKIDKTKLHNLN